MIITTFEPGAGTAYIVIFHRLDSQEERALGNSGVLFGFCARGTCPQPVSAFQAQGYLDSSYYAEKMGDQLYFTRSAGMHVLAYLTGREIGGQILPLNSLGWREDWRDQLTSLQQQQKVVA